MNRKLIFTLCIAVMIAGCRNKQSATGTAQPKHRKKMLTAVSVQSIRVVNFPKYGGNGEAWDAYAPFATDPDLFVKLLWNNSAIYTSEVRDNVAYGTIAEFSQGFPFSLVPFDQPLMLELFDSDGVSSDDNVGYFNFSPLDYQDQNSIVLSAGDLKIELQVQWFYE